jgi:hypothetical protein
VSDHDLDTIISQNARTYYQIETVQKTLIGMAVVQVIFDVVFVWILLS